MWISQKNENQRRTGDCQQTPTCWPEKAHHRLNSFPKAARILKRSQYQKIFRHGKRFVGQLFAIDYRTGYAPRPRLGLTVSKKYGKAHERNRFKRVLREAFRELQAELPSSLEMNVSPRKSNSVICKAVILDEIKKFINHYQSKLCP